MVKTTIYPNEILIKKLKDKAEKESRSLNNLIILILNKYFKNGKN